MDFFKSVFSDDPEPSNGEIESDSDQESHLNPQNPLQNPKPNPSSDPNPSIVSNVWSFGGLIKTLTSKSETVLQTYRRDLEEFSSGLKKETASIREAASRAIKDLPASLDVGASVAQESLESVGQVIDDIGTSVWKGAAEIISQGKESLLAVDLDSDYSDNSQLQSQPLSHQKLKSYCRFEMQVRNLQGEFSTYNEEPEDLEEFRKWKLGFELGEMGEELENLFEENDVIEEYYNKLVPGVIDRETFWSRYFFRVHKLRQVEDARANLVKRAISGEVEEELSWDIDDEDDEVKESSNVGELRGKIEENVKSEEKDVKIDNAGVEKGEKSLVKENENSVDVMESNGDNVGGKTDGGKVGSDKFEGKLVEKVLAEGEVEPSESCKDSDVSVVSSQPSLPEEVDLGWDEIEDIGSGDENSKVAASGSSTSRINLRKRLSTAEEEEDLSWDIEDDDEAIKS
ncbi:BSD domain [Dillenia turbinata]|uniref:BSD domain n=1 Tax=Dillenia turbinata TaxID=194707 RepID=A0AAN8UL66_9MAGN